jgi:hypothetical protein
MTLAEPIQIARKVAAIFETLNIRYAIGGSLASSLYGIPRATQDVDIVAAIQPDQANALTLALQKEFFINDNAIRTSLAKGSAKPSRYDNAFGNNVCALGNMRYIHSFTKQCAIKHASSVFRFAASCQTAPRINECCCKLFPR